MVKGKIKMLLRRETEKKAHTTNRDKKIHFVNIDTSIDYAYVLVA